MTDVPRSASEEAHSATSPPGEGVAARPAEQPSVERPTSPRTLRPLSGAEEAVSPPPVEPAAAAEAAPAAPATAVAEEAGSPGRPGIDAVGAVAVRPVTPAAPTRRLGRPSGPVLAGAAIAGLLLGAFAFAVAPHVMRRIAPQAHVA